jgi:thiamine biosynthesis lipoprotein
MEARGFDREHRTGAVVATPLADADATWRDVILDDQARTIMLRRALVLDLGAVAKGLAIDMAARELVPFTDFAINAGGDLWLGGHNSRGEPWTIGIRHPRDAERTVETVTVSNGAVCTSGDYERRSPADAAQHHIVDPRVDSRGSASPVELASVTVTAPSAMVADALGTAAFVLGPEQGIALLERHGVDGVCFTPALERFATAGFRSTHAPSDGALVSHA